MARTLPPKNRPAAAKPQTKDELHYDDSPHQRNVNARAIAEAAYFRWLKRGAPHGDDQTDWFAAEKQLRRSRTP